MCNTCLNVSRNVEVEAKTVGVEAYASGVEALAGSTSPTFNSVPTPPPAEASTPIDRTIDRTPELTESINLNYNK